MTDQFPQRWKPGQSGNPAGRPPGSKNKVTLLAEALMEGQAEEITQSLIDATTKKGNVSAGRTLLTRMVPPARRRPVTVDLPQTDTPSGVIAAHAAIIQAAGAGEITPDEAHALALCLDHQRKAIETGQMEERIRRVEEQLGLMPEALPDAA